MMWLYWPRHAKPINHFANRTKSINFFLCGCSCCIVAWRARRVNCDSRYFFFFLSLSSYSCWISHGSGWHCCRLRCHSLVHVTVACSVFLVSTTNSIFIIMPFSLFHTNTYNIHNTYILIFIFLFFAVAHRAIRRVWPVTVQLKHNALHAERDALHSRASAWIAARMAIMAIKSDKNACYARTDVQHVRVMDFVWHARRHGRKIRKTVAFPPEAIIVMNVSGYAC